uniref:Toxin-like structure LSTX-D9 n=1 Tax=Lygus hesperus TaxID=30085 RepID=A0A0A9W0L1_LYGHE
MDGSFRENLLALRALTLPSQRLSVGSRKTSRSTGTQDYARPKIPSLRHYQRRCTYQQPIKIEDLFRAAVKVESRYSFREPPPYPYHQDWVYASLRSFLTLVDLLALSHFLPAAWDHPFRPPPIYRPLSHPVHIAYRVVEPPQDI